MDFTCIICYLTPFSSSIPTAISMSISLAFQPILCICLLAQISSFIVLPTFPDASSSPSKIAFFQHALIYFLLLPAGPQFLVHQCLSRLCPHTHNCLMPGSPFSSIKDLSELNSFFKIQFSPLVLPGSLHVISPFLNYQKV